MISNYERKSFEKAVATRELRNIITIKNGVKDRYDDYEEVKIIRDSVCYIGRIVEYKGIGELIAAFDLVRKRCPDAKLNIYGDGEDLNKYIELAKGNKNVSFYGKTNEPLAKMAENEIFVLPSYREGLSLSLLDAAMMKKEIIASDVDGNPEVVMNKRTGILVPAKNVKELAEAIVRLGL